MATPQYQQEYQESGSRPPSFGSRRQPLAAIAPSRGRGSGMSGLVGRRNGMRIHRAVAGWLRSPLDVGSVPAATLAREGNSLRARHHEQVPRAAPPRYPLNGTGPTGRADQIGMIPIRRDQRQGFRRPVLLNAASSHVLPCTSDSQCSPQRKGEQSAVSLNRDGGCRGWLCRKRRFP